MARTIKNPHGGFVSWDTWPSSPNATVVLWAKSFPDNARYRGLNQRWTAYFQGRQVQSAGSWSDPLVTGACTLPPGAQCYEVLLGNVVRFDLECIANDAAYEGAVKAYRPPLVPPPPPPPPRVLDPPPKRPIAADPPPWHPTDPPPPPKPSGGPPPIPRDEPKPGSSIYVDTYAPVAILGLAGAFAGFAFFKR